MQNVIVILIIALAAGYIGYSAWRMFVPKKGRGCGGGCGCGHEKGGAKAAESAGAGGGKTVFIASGDLINRVKARKG